MIKCKYCPNFFHPYSSRNIMCLRCSGTTAHYEPKIKRDAYRAVAKAISLGELERLPCEVCEDPESQGHHEDYEKPLVVIWLCRKHHLEKHGKRMD